MSRSGSSTQGDPHPLHSGGTAGAPKGMAGSVGRPDTFALRQSRMFVTYPDAYRSCLGGEHHGWAAGGFYGPKYP